MSFFAFAEKEHQEHRRLSGDPYITHPLAVASILAELEQDVTTIAAALLHDVIEDAEVDSKSLAKLFGPEITKLVETCQGSLFRRTRISPLINSIIAEFPDKSVMR